MPISEDYIELKFRTLENDIKDIKNSVQKLEEKQRDARIPVALISLIGVVFATMGSVVGTVLTALCKANGWF